MLTIRKTIMLTVLFKYESKKTKVDVNMVVKSTMLSGLVT